MPYIKTELICPLMCKCVVESYHHLGFTDQTESGLAKIADVEFREWLRKYWADQMRFNAILEVQHNTIMQCKSHSHLGRDADHYNGIKHLHGNAHSPDTCKCSLAYWFDDRFVSTKHNPIEHPYHTVRCDVHKYLWDTKRHFNVVKRENYAKNAVVNIIAEYMGIEAHKIHWRWDKDRRFVVDTTATGITEMDVYEAMHFLPKQGNQASGELISTSFRVLEVAA